MSNWAESGQHLARSSSHLTSLLESTYVNWREKSVTFGDKIKIKVNSTKSTRKIGCLIGLRIGFSKPQALGGAGGDGTDGTRRGREGGDGYEYGDEPSSVEFLRSITTLKLGRGVTLFPDALLQPRVKDDE